MGDLRKRQKRGRPENESGPFLRSRGTPSNSSENQPNIQPFGWPRVIPLPMPPVPVKLKHDAILEAVFEVRFDPGTDLPEVILGRLAEPAKWPGFKGVRLPAAELPQAIRLADPNLINLPLIEFKLENGSQIVRVGSHAIQCVQTKPYEGWDIFYALMRRAIDNLFDALPTAAVRRLGMRYINVLEPERHHINSIAELQISVTVGGTVLSDCYNLNFKVPAVIENIECLVRVATKDFTNPPIPGTGHTLIDTDTYTTEPLAHSSKDTVFGWLNNAHEVKNAAFFNLFNKQQIERMQAD